MKYLFATVYHRSKDLIKQFDTITSKKFDILYDFATYNLESLVPMFHMTSQVLFFHLSIQVHVQDM